MIDVIINEFDGLTVAHNEKRLDAYGQMSISKSSGETFLLGDNVDPMPLGKLAPSMLELVRNGIKGQSIRVKNWGIARISTMDIRITA